MCPGSAYLANITLHQRQQILDETVRAAMFSSLKKNPKNKQHQQTKTQKPIPLGQHDCTGSSNNLPECIFHVSLHSLKSM